MTLVFLPATMLCFATACNDDDDNNSNEPPQVQSFVDIGFNDIADVFAEVQDDETVVFLLRHAERGIDFSPAGLLTENGKAQAQTVGTKIKTEEPAFYAHSDYERTKQTCENIAAGRGDTFTSEEWDILHGEYFMNDPAKLKASNLYSWGAAARWAYEGKYEDKGFYNLDSRAAEWMSALKAHLQGPSMKRINVLVSHDYVVAALTIYASNRQVDLHYYANHKWINYLAGIAIIIDAEGNMRFKTVRGLSKGVMIK